MSERRNRRRLHARARALGVPVEQVPRRSAPRERPGRSFSTRSGDAPLWQDTDSPYREEPAGPGEAVGSDEPHGPEGAHFRRSGAPTCCEVALTRRVMDGGTIIMLTTHQAECPIWSANR